MTFLVDSTTGANGACGYSTADETHRKEVARTAASPDDRLDALQGLINQVPAVDGMAELLLGRLESDTDAHILWPCATWLVERYGEVAAARRLLIARLMHDPNPDIRKSVMQLLSIRFGAAEPVRRVVAHAMVNDPDSDIRQLAGSTSVELERIRVSPPAPVPLSYSSRQLKIWAAAETELIDALHRASLRGRA